MEYKFNSPERGCPEISIHPEWASRMKVLKDHLDPAVQVLGPGPAYTQADKRAAVTRIMALGKLVYESISAEPGKVSIWEGQVLFL